MPTLIERLQQRFTNRSRETAKSYSDIVEANVAGEELDVDVVEETLLKAKVTPEQFDADTKNLKERRRVKAQVDEGKKWRALAEEARAELTRETAERDEYLKAKNAKIATFAERVTEYDLFATQAEGKLHRLAQLAPQWMKDRMAELNLQLRQLGGQIGEIELEIKACTDQLAALQSRPVPEKPNLESVKTAKQIESTTRWLSNYRNKLAPLLEERKKLLDESQRLEEMVVNP